VSQQTSVIPHIIDQYAEEAAFLWLLRNNAVNAPHYGLRRILMASGLLVIMVEKLARKIWNSKNWVRFLQRQFLHLKAIKSTELI
jgi:hypothetical protein